jgi:hypothetical protein
MGSGHTPRIQTGPGFAPPVRPGVWPLLSFSACLPHFSAGGSVPPEIQSRPAVDRRRDTQILSPSATTRGASPCLAPASSLEMAAAGCLTTVVRQWECDATKHLGNRRRGLSLLAGMGPAS